MKRAFSFLSSLMMITVLSTGWFYVSAATAAPQVADLTPQNMRLLGQFGGLVTCVAIDENYAYVGEGPRLVIMDISNPAHIIVTAQSIVLEDTVEGITEVNGAAYVADNAGGLYVMDVSDSTAPLVTYHMDTPGQAKKVSLKGDNLYLADGTSGLLIYSDVTDATPVYQTAISLTNALDVVTEGNYAYVADFSDGIAVVNIINPLAPSLVHTYDTAGSVRGVATDNTSLFVADFTEGLEIYDLTVPGTLTPQGHYMDGASQAVQLRLQGIYAYLADGNQGMQVIDIHNKNLPTLYGSLGLKGWFTAGLDVSGGHAYLAANDFGFRIVDISNPASPTITGMGAIVPDIGYAMRMSVWGTHAYVVNENRTGTVLGMEIVDVTNPGYANNQGIYYSPGVASGLASFTRNGHIYVYLADTNTLRILNVDDADNPTLVKSIPAPVNSSYANISVNIPLLFGTPTGYLCDILTNAVSLYDLTNPENPSLLGSVTLGAGIPQAVQTSGTYTYVAAGSGGLRILDFSEVPYHEVSHLNLTGYAGNVSIWGTTAYVVTGTGGLRIVNVYNPTSPVEVGAYTGEFVYDVKVNGILAFLSTENGVRVLNVADPAHLKSVGFYPNKGTNYSIGIANHGADTSIYLGAAVNGFYEFQFAYRTYLPGVMK